MKQSYLVFFAVVLVLSLAAVAGAHSPEGELYFAVQFPDAAVPTMDGDLSDWDIVPEMPYTIGNDRLFSPDAGIRVAERGSTDPGDLSMRHLLGWNESSNQLYIMSEVFDNVHNADRENPSAFWADDAWEIEVNPDATAAEFHNQEGEPVNNFSYKFAVPPVDGAYQFYRPQRGLTWLIDGTKWVDFGWGFTGDQFGESTYFYELAITPILSMPNDEASALDGLVEFDLTEGEIIHVSVNVGDFDEACTDCVDADYQGFWAMSGDVGCCNATSDLVMAPLEPAIIEAVAATAVEGFSWGQIKFGYTE
jgi:hypothetical protein